MPEVEDRQFSASLYAVLLLSVVGYGIALDSPLRLLLGVTLILANIWVTRSRPDFGMPRFHASAIALLTGLWSAMALFTGMLMPLFAVTQWLLFLLLTILWSRQTNRTYAQLLVMSLVLMVTGAINTADLIYGIILLAYILVLLRACLQFHLKVETEHAAKAFGIPREDLTVGSTREDRLAYNRSLRRLTTVISTFSIAVGVLVFLFFPRAAAPSLMLRLTATQQAPLTGFSERISLNQVAKITQSSEVVAHVTVTEDGKPWRSPELYLRGVALDVYTGSTPDRTGQNYQWIRGPIAWRSANLVRATAGTDTNFFAFSSPPAKTIKQNILLNPTGTATVFAVDGPFSINPDRDVDLQYFRADGSIRSVEAARNSLHYTVFSTGQTPLPPHPEDLPEPMESAFDGYGMSPDQALRQSQIDPRIAEMARRPEVSGRDEIGDFASRRGNGSGPSPLDARIAQSIEAYLQQHYDYTLDLTDTSRKRNEDPITAFLYDFKRGHCEYFAGAMTLMCQSLGLNARVVVGFRAGAGDYNTLGDYYLIKQSSAHAWVEVLTPEGWRRYDPTTERVYYAQRKAGGVFRSIANIFDYLQYKWASSVVTYSNENRASVWQSVEDSVHHSVLTGNDIAKRIQGFFRSDSIYQLSSHLLGGAIIIAILALVAAVVVYLVERRKLYRRAERIGLTSLPSHQQLRLARQLAFYDDLLRLLARQQIHRPADLTPREFARSLTFLPADAYDEIAKLTDIYYRVRYGDQTLRTSHRRRLASSITRISSLLSSHPGRVRSVEI